MLAKMPITRNEIIRCLKEYGEISVDELADYIWRVNYLNMTEHPLKAIKPILNELEKEGIITIKQGVKNIVVLNHSKLIRNCVKERGIILAPWRLRIIGKIITIQSIIFNFSSLETVFDKLKKSSEINQNVSYFPLTRDEFHLSFNYEGIESDLSINPEGDFYIEAVFQGKIHPELIELDLSEFDSERLQQAILGTAFFILYTTLKRIIREIDPLSSIKIIDFEYLRRRR